MNSLVRTYSQEKLKNKLVRFITSSGYVFLKYRGVRKYAEKYIDVKRLVTKLVNPILSSEQTFSMVHVTQHSLYCIIYRNRRSIIELDGA